MGTDPASDKVLSVQITHVLGAGGGAWSGPKTVTVLAELLDSGEVMHYNKINEWNIGGVFGGYTSTCAILERSADAITKDLNEWVQNPTTKVEEKPAPKGTTDDETPKASASEPTPAFSAPPSTPASAAVPVAEDKTQK